MNKLIKGAVTGAAGIALLLGGAGSFAAWNQTAALGSTKQTIQTGALGVTAADDATWSNATGPIDPASYRIVPGETLKFTQTVQITARGNALVAKLGFTNPTLTPKTTGDTNFSKTDLKVTNSTLPAGVKANGDGTYTITSAADGAKLTVELDVTFANVTGDTDQNTSVDLGATTLTIEETAPGSNPGK